MLEGRKTSRVLFVSDFLRVDESVTQTPLAGERRDLLFGALKRANIFTDDCAYTCIHDTFLRHGDVSRLTDADRLKDYARIKELVLEMKPNVIVPLGEYALKLITGYEGITNWHCSVIPAKAELAGIKCLPMLHPEFVQRAYSNVAYLSVASMKLKQEMQHAGIASVKRKFIHSLTPKQSCEYLYDVVDKTPMISVDIETGLGQINTVGFGVSADESIAIRVQDRTLDEKTHHMLWRNIDGILRSNKLKVFQNFIYDCQYLSLYGIYVNAVHHDTMWAMKFLHPELDKGLDNVGRLYTNYPYWKEDNKDWGNVQDWPRHLEYNCKDTQGTLAACQNQKLALESRGLDRLFTSFVMRFVEPIREMCTRGLQINPDALKRLQEDATRALASHQDLFDRLCESKLGYKINPRSPKQLQDGLKKLGYKLPTNKGRESADKKSLIKLRRKHPEEDIFPALIEISKENKRLSSYLDFSYDSDLKVRYTLDGCGTETGRWSGYTDIRGKGFNPQTVPKFARKIFCASKDKFLVQIDLQQAESRYVAYEAPEPKLMQMLANGDDVHKYVASQIFNKNEALVSKNERNLGKKSGHSANYGVGPDTFAEACLVENNIVLSRMEATKIIQGYYAVFPGIRRRQQNIQEEIRKTRCLRTPLGRERVFYDRMSDGLFREAYAYCPQSTIPDITNHLMLHLFGNCELLLQVHDSLLVQADSREHAAELAAMARDYSAWHPNIFLPGGQLVIPVDVECGNNWKDMEKI